MKTSNHPAHGPVSLDRLHQISEILSKASAQSDGGNIGYAMADAVKVIDGILESMAREQVRREHAAWSKATFGDVGPVGPLKHLSKEVLEAAAEPGDLSEWADMQFLLWDAQRRAGISDEQITQAMVEKLAVNKQREWPEPKDGEPRLHIKKAGNSPVTPDGWIPVSERMPEESGRYWCYVEEQNSLGKSHYQWNCSWNGEVWSEKALTGRVTHWIPLPAAPKQEVM
ncbi:dATP/dGTP pyrophosphohydrolase domain-containing protein [Citrobacter portucalensis]|uniref:dATP/dGTP pyrophosphohydrolase domain-containing protein n=1 Tax=Citrobacter portucalensis TaxID=1639133 RepID=UPI0039FDAB12